MKKTPLASRFLKQLICVNDQICFSALQQWDFANRLAPMVNAIPKEFSTAAFPNNPYAASIFRSVSDLATFAGEAELVALQMGVVASVEHLLAYMSDVQHLRESLVTTSGDPIFDDAEEEQLRLKVCRWKGSDPASGYFKTLGYFRHLRNHFAHVNAKPTSAFATYIRSHGTPLNKFWNNGRTDLHGVDFRSLAGIQLTPDLALGVMNLLRVCLRHVDDIVADTLSLEDAVHWIVRDIRSAPRNNGIDAGQLESKVTARLEMEWGVKADVLAIHKAVEAML
ncbi:hypothetical protein FJ942_06975 [Mesorhizobium sp. B2-4-2]|uniref:hypothetical protein n=1 Tax=unclassified Mesorhizobium TaxID=325217 RepID=UPI001128CDD2|nr:MULTISPECIES: hypothetical protein [unclassified Mesorhizobium]MBZ9920868.1 hypothetical protein [Mesorhizobium sp. BR1-1-7]MBZ9955600.1 hypothetical protein [Mesorhizobium sp. BR1-1-15]MBZ9962030.1 hypothetical protein [Mesorhizobium sp. BR1-1-14]MBZ9972288.1 hypothetical protein [Mesorhizobium sp. BR1-1-12]TPL46032.1 hypothetical protein FJ937_24475 [Mesorhizobium sp. B2-4-4]